VPYTAEAKLSMRLVQPRSGKDCKLFEAFVKKECPDAEIVREGMLHPYVGTNTGAEAEAGAKAMKDAFGIEPAFVKRAVRLVPS